MWQLKVKEIKEAWETKKLGFVRTLNKRNTVFGKLLKIVSCVRRIVFSEDFWPGLLERFGFVDGGWTRAESICLFCCCLFHCEYGCLAQSFDCRLLQYQVRMHKRIESLDGSVMNVLVRLLQHSDKGVRNSKVPGGLNTEWKLVANLQEISSMAWVISSEDQGGIFSFGCSISLIVLMTQIIRSFAFIFPLMIVWRNNLFSTHHWACAFPHAVRSAPVCDGFFGSTAGNCEVLDGVLLSPEDQAWRKLGSVQFLALPALVLLDVPPLGSGMQPYALSPVRCPASWAAESLFSPVPVLYLVPWDPCQKLFQTVEWVGAGEMCQHQ